MFVLQTPFQILKGLKDVNQVFAEEVSLDVGSLQLLLECLRLHVSGERGGEGRGKREEERGGKKAGEGESGTNLYLHGKEITLLLEGVNCLLISVRLVSCK